jgi:hypothetical protein
MTDCIENKNDLNELVITKYIVIILQERTRAECDNDSQTCSEFTNSIKALNPTFITVKIQDCFEM